MSMWSPNFEGGTPVGQHHVGPPVRGTTRETPGVAKPYTGAPGENRGTDETMGTGIGGTVTNVGVPETRETTGTEAAAIKVSRQQEPFPEPSGTAKVMAGIKEMGDQAVSSVTEAVEKVNAKIK